MDESESDESSELYEELDYSFEHCYICKEYSNDKVFVMPGTCKTRGIIIKDEYLDNEIVVFKEGEIGPVEEGVQIVYYNDIVELTSEEYYENFGQTEFLFDLGTYYKNKNNGEFYFFFTCCCYCIDCWNNLDNIHNYSEKIYYNDNKQFVPVYSNIYKKVGSEFVKLFENNIDNSNKAKCPYCKETYNYNISTTDETIADMGISYSVVTNPYYYEYIYYDVYIPIEKNMCSDLARLIVEYIIEEDEEFEEFV